MVVWPRSVMHRPLRPRACQPMTGHGAKTLVRDACRAEAGAEALGESSVVRLRRRHRVREVAYV